MKFLVPAGTSRGVLTTKDSWFILLSDPDFPDVVGIGECSLIPGLSHDNIDQFESKLKEVCRLLNNDEEIDDQFLQNYPAIQFGLETAMLDLTTGGKRVLFASDFTSGKIGIPINGLIWMGDKRSMMEQITVKIDSGFNILKLKVGALDFQDELSVLASIRSRYNESDLEIRLDANGAWISGEAIDKLNRLSEYKIHSVEQPILAGSIDEMAEVCRFSPIDIALDEELIGISVTEKKRSLLSTINPAYIILKPTLLGGISAAEEWIKIAETHKIAWWLTSALESNIGLNAISQWTATLDTSMPQGLGTGRLFSNNIPSPLKIVGSKIYYLPDQQWDLNNLLNN